MSFITSPVRVRVPATSANLGPGFDALGLALARYDEVTAAVTDGGLEVEVAGEGAAEVDRGEAHLVVRAMRRTFERLGVRPPGLALRCRNEVPHGRGLGSSAAAVVAGIVAARELAGAEDLDDDGVLALAGEFEGHPDNVAACLAGGLTIAWMHEGRSRFARLEPSPEIAVTVCVPVEQLATEEARRLIPDTVPHRNASANVARAALLVAALTGRPDLLYEATEDLLHQPYRLPAMSGTRDTLERLRTAGVPAVVSGAGPSILALTDQSGVDLVAKEVGNGWKVLRLGVDRDGARVQLVGS